MNRLMLLLSLAMPLAACGSEPDVEMKNASVSDVAREVAESGGDGPLMRPGTWESKVSIEEVSIPGMPADAAQRMQEMFAARQAQAFESCLTAEQARRPREDFFSGKGDQCRYDHFTMGDGKIDAKMRCTEGGATQIMEMAGTYSPESYSMTMSMNQEGGPEPADGMRMRMRVDAKRIGACTGSKEA